MSVIDPPSSVGLRDRAPLHGEVSPPVAPSSTPAPTPSRWGRLVSILPLAMIVAAIPLQRLRGSFPTEGFFHSDIAFLPALFSDVAGGGSLASWGLPEAPYFIPDWPLYFVSWLVTPTYTSGMALFALLQLALFAAAWVAVVRCLSPRPLVAATIGVGLLVAAALAGQVPADYASVSFAHFGTFILTLAALALYLRHRFGSPHAAASVGVVGERRSLAATGLLVALSVASDRLFIPLWVLPLAAIEALRLAGAVIARSLRWGEFARSGRLLAVTAAATAAGFALRSVLVRTSRDYSVDVAADLPLRSRIRNLVEVFVDSELTELWPYYSLAVLAAALLWCMQLWLRRHDEPFVVVGLWFAFAVGATLSAEALTGGPAWRFHQFMYHVPVLMVGVAAVALTKRMSAAVPRSVAFGGSAVVFGCGLFPVGELSLTHTPPEASCLDAVVAESGSRVGIGNYAASRLAVVHSDHDLEVGTRNSWMAPEEDVHSRAWARHSADFAILYPTIFGAMPANTIRSLADNTATETTCGAWQILDFGPGGIDLDRLAAPGGRAEVPGCWYTNSIGTPDAAVGPDGTCALRVGPSDSEAAGGTYIGFGAYYEVGPGTYRADAELSAGSGADGVFEVAVWDANTGELQSVHAAPLSDPEITVVATGAGPELSFEARILYQGGEPLVLERMGIERLD